MRKLATIQRVSEIIPIEGATTIELAKSRGWQYVVKKGEFNTGDTGVYFEIDSYLPVHDRYEFLRKSSYKNNEYMGEGFRIKTMRFMGNLSQGLFLPLLSFKDVDFTGYNEGDDVTELLGVRKWEIPETVTSGGIQKGEKPYGIPTTDEIRIQSATELIDELKIGECGYIITTKMDGTSCTIFHKDGEVGVCGRNFEYVDDEKCDMWKFAHSRGLVDKLRTLGRNIAVQGEFCAPGIQKNRLRLNAPELFVFDIFDLDKTEYIRVSEMVEITHKLGLKLADIEEEGETFNYTLDELLERARGKYPGGKHKEGIVIRSRDIPKGRKHRISFKVINNDFLLKEEE
jgi:RNA ligase (TIGR02306 family)